MFMGVLVLTPDVIERAGAVRAYAEAHPYRPYETPVPGMVPEHVLRSGTYRIVFSITEMLGARWRHLSVSCAGAQREPNPVVVEEIAHLFGFVQGERILQFDPDQGATVLLQRSE